MSDLKNNSGAKNREKLFPEFSEPTWEEWRQAVDRLLKGAPYEKIMLTDTYEGITLEPMYRQEDLEKVQHKNELPGSGSYVRGTHPLGYKGDGWFIAQEIPYPGHEEFNKALRHDLMRGQNAVNLILDQASQMGLDPDQAKPGQVGKAGTSIASLKGLSSALDGVDLTAIPIYAQAGVASIPFAGLLVSWMKKQDFDLKTLRGSIGMDPIAGLSIYGSLPISLSRAMDELAILTKWATVNAPEVKTVEIYGHSYHNAGASSVQELAISLATSVYYLRELTDRGIDISDAARRFYFAFSVGSNFFMEVAKLRAARMLWSRIVEASGGDSEAQKMTLHARTSSANKSTLDAHVNLLRGTTEAFSAVIGGADSLHVTPFDEPLGLPNEFSRRIARNTQIMLSEESHFDFVADPSGGSWYVESLTQQVAEEAWTLFQEIEGDGGIVESMKSGKIQTMCRETEAKREKNLKTRKDVRVGINQYPNPTEKPLEERLPDYQQLYEQRSEVLQTLRTSSEHEAEVKVLQSMQAICDSNDENVFEEIINAASNGATLGELTNSLRHAEEKSTEVEPLNIHRQTEFFEKLRNAVDEWKNDGPQVFLANVGPIGKYMPRVDFTRSFFQVAGFNVAGDEWFKDVDEAISAAKESGANVVTIVGLDSVYPDSVPAIANAFTDSKVDVIVAGYPKDHIEAFKEAGVKEFIHVKSDCYAILKKLAESMGVFS